ncbi:MAG: hypothetical protein WAW23_07720, partial [Candidatus Methanoperedens sp.]
VFHSQKLLNERQRRGFGYFFLRWQRGPFSKNVNEDLELLKNSNFVNWGRDNITLTKEGEKLLGMTKEIFDSNETILKYINQIVEKYSCLSPEQIKEKTYETTIMVPRIGKLMKIIDVPEKQIIMYGLSEKKARYSFLIPDEWLETLEVIFDKEAMNLLKNAGRRDS